VLRLLVANGNRTFFERGTKILPSVSSSSPRPVHASKKLIQARYSLFQDKMVLWDTPFQKTKYDPVKSFFEGMYKNNPDPVSCDSYQPNSRQRKQTASPSGKNEKKPFVSSLLKTKKTRLAHFYTKITSDQITFQQKNPLS
jgi:hypothetical protein